MKKQLFADQTNPSNVTNTFTKKCFTAALSLLLSGMASNVYAAEQHFWDWKWLPCWGATSAGGGDGDIYNCNEHATRDWYDVNNWFDDVLPHYNDKVTIQNNMFPAVGTTITYNQSNPNADDAFHYGIVEFENSFSLDVNPLIFDHSAGIFSTNQLYLSNPSADMSGTKVRYWLNGGDLELFARPGALVSQIDIQDGGLFDLESGKIYSNTGEWAKIVLQNGGELHQSGGQIDIHKIEGAGTFTMDGGITNLMDLYIEGSSVLSGGVLTYNRGIPQAQEDMGTPWMGSVTVSGSLELSGDILVRSGLWGPTRGDTSPFHVVENGSVLQKENADILVGDLNVGFYGDSDGSYQIDGGTIETTELTLGHYGTGTFTQNGGQVDVIALDDPAGYFDHDPRAKGELRIGSDHSGVGDYTLNDGTLNTDATIVGEQNIGQFTQSGGIHTTKELYIAKKNYSIGTSNGTYDLKGGLLETELTNVGEGKNGYSSTGGVGQFIQSAGIHQTAELLIGRINDSYSMSGGQLNVEIPGGTAQSTVKGTFTQSGGTHYVDGTLGIFNEDPMAHYNLFNAKFSSPARLHTANTQIGKYTWPSKIETGTFNQSNGYHRIDFDLLLGDENGGYGNYNMTGGLLWADRIHVYEGSTFTLNIVTSVEDELRLEKVYLGDNSPLTTQTSAADTSDNPFFNSGTFWNQGTFNWFSGDLDAEIFNDGIMNFGPEYDVRGNFTLNKGTLQLDGGLFEHIAFEKAMTNEGIIHGFGTIIAETLINKGQVVLNGISTMDGIVMNKSGASFEIVDKVANFTGKITNDGKFQVVNGTAVYEDQFINNGEYFSDPSNNYFTDLLVNETGYLIGGLGDNFYIANNFENHSLMNTTWNTTQSYLGFTSDNTFDMMHDMYITGADFGSITAGYLDNFSWGIVDITGQKISLYDGNIDEGGALYVGEILGLSIAEDLITNISGADGLNIYYNAVLSGNTYLAGLDYQLTTGGWLRAVNEPVPEPATMLLFGTGLAGLAGSQLRRKKKA